MDRNDNMRKIYIIIDNAPINTSKQVEEMIKGRNRGYKFVYRTPYSPELNSIKQFWSLMKGKIKHHKLHNSETIEARIIDATYEIPIRHLKNIIQHSKNHFVIGLNCILI
jgi:transposase